MSYTSTVPAAVAKLQAKMLAVKAANTALNPGVFVGEMVGGSVADNFLAIGSPTGEGQLVTNYVQGFTDAGAVGRSESYAMVCMIRAWSEAAGATVAVDRFGDAFALLNALITECATDPHGGNALNDGLWRVGQVENPLAGKIRGRGWGVILTFTVQVTNVFLIPD